MTPNKTNVEKKGHDFNAIHSNFVNNLGSLKLFVNNLTPIALKHDKRFTDKFNNSAKKIAQICGIPYQTDVGKSQVKLKLTDNKIHKIAI